MERRLRSQAWKRAGRCCEYCQMPQEFDFAAFEIDHIIASSHGGKTTSSNLALACFMCNSYKGTNVAGIDPKTKRVARLFHPRRDRWKRHFRWKGPKLAGRTGVGRATVEVLRINLTHRIAHRQALLDEGIFPP